MSIPQNRGMYLPLHGGEPDDEMVAPVPTLNFTFTDPDADFALIDGDDLRAHGEGGEKVSENSDFGPAPSSRAELVGAAAAIFAALLSFFVIGLVG